MSDQRLADRRAIWDARHRKNPQPGDAAFVLQAFAALLPASGAALDVACGTGANSLFLARSGLTVEAWDFSAAAIELLNRAARSLPVSTRCMAIEPASFVPASHDVIVNCHYLDRAIVPAMKAALKPGGLLFFQTFTRDKVIDQGPSKPDFLLAKDELPQLMAGLEIVAYQDEGANPDAGHPLAGRACIVGRLA